MADLPPDSPADSLYTRHIGNPLSELPLDSDKLSDLVGS